MQPAEFICKWRSSKLKERSGAQEHFLDLCTLLDEPTPAEADPDGEWYTFERGAKKTGGGDGWADVWKRHHFAWEYKGKNKDLGSALHQLQQYSLALESPPLLIVSDMDTIQIHTSFTNTRQETYVVTLDDLADPSKRQWLKWAFTDPEQLRPGETREQITAEASERFADLAQELREAGHDRLKVAHFISRLLFCMFAEDIRILPKQLFSQMLEAAHREPSEFQGLASDLFRAMHKGGRIGYDKIEWFNGGLFDGDEALPLTREQIETCLAAARLDWSAIEPSILGTLFERGMDPAKRSQLGAHYTDPATIQRLVDALIVEPLETEWSSVRAEIETHLAAADKQRNPTSRIKKADAALQGFLLRLRDFTVLDPACGSGNFLYLALKALKDFEHRVSLEVEQLGMHRALPEVGVKNVRGQVRSRKHHHRAGGRTKADCSLGTNTPDRLCHGCVSYTALLVVSPACA